MPNKPLTELADIFSCPENAMQMRELLADFLTEAEIEDIWERWKIVEGLLNGRTQREIKESTGVSISKVTRASHLLKSQGEGFRRVFRECEKNKKKA